MVREKQSSRAAGVGLADRLADRPIVDDKLAILGPKAEQDPFDMTELTIEAEKQQQTPLRHKAPFIVGLARAGR